MRVLLVCSYKDDLAGHAAPFVLEQMHALQTQGVDCGLFLVKGRGIRGYLGQFRPLKRFIVSFDPSLIHAHFGLCGLLANIQRKIPVITTYHGSDINDSKTFRFSKIALWLSAWNIFVSNKTMQKAGPNHKCTLLPCGVDLTQVQLTSKPEARRLMHLNENKKYVLFAGAFEIEVKNAPLAKQTVGLLKDSSIELIELKGYTRDEVALLMCAADVLLMTSFNEGSPQVIKEALACGCPIVSVDVGDVRERMDGVGGCFMADSNHPEELAELMRKALSFTGRTKGRDKVLADGLDNQNVAKKLVEIYTKIGL